MYKPISETHADEQLSDNTQINYCEQCGTCIYWDGGNAFSNRSDKSSCQKFMYPDMKPIGVINNVEECPYHTEA